MKTPAKKSNFAAKPKDASMERGEKGQEHWKTVFLLYGTFVLLRFLLALLLADPVIIPDELTYKSMAYGFYKWQDFFALSPGMVGAPTNIGYIFYQFVLSPIFFFDGFFLTAGKLFNALLINTTIFSLYAILKDFIPKRAAAVSAALPLFLPSFGYASFLMAENVFIPFTALFLFFLYRAFSRGPFYFAALSAVTWSILLLTKPHASVFIGAVFLGGGFLILFFKGHEENNRLDRKILISIGIFFIVIILLFSVFLFFSKESFSNTTGFYFSVAKNIPSEIFKIIGTETFDLRRFFLLAITHLGIFFLLFLLPFLVTFWTWIDALKTKNKKNLIFLSLGLVIFFELLALVLLISIYHAPIQSFARFHGRFYSVIFFFFVVSFSAFRKKVKWSNNRKITLVILTPLTTLTLIPALFYFKSPERFVLPFDYPEMGGLAFLPIGAIVIILGLFWMVTIQTIFFNRSRMYFIFFITFAVLSNFSVTQTLLRSFQPQRLLTHPAREFVSQIVADPESRVAVFDREELYGSLTVFWLPYHFTRATFNLKEPVLKREDIPSETAYAVLYGEFSLDFFPIEEYRQGKCTILRLDEKKN